MPTYGYKCDNCGNVFDVRQRFQDEPRYECPKCQHIARRTFHAPPVIYKGSGFYTTDYARKSSPSSETSSSSPSSKSESKSESKTESKSESSSNTVSDSKKESKAS